MQILQLPLDSVTIYARTYGKNNLKIQCITLFENGLEYSSKHVLAEFIILIGQNVRLVMLYCINSDVFVNTINLRCSDWHLLSLSLHLCFHCSKAILKLNILQ